MTITKTTHSYPFHIIFENNSGGKEYYYVDASTKEEALKNWNEVLTPDGERYDDYFYENIEVCLVVREDLNNVDNDIDSCEPGDASILRFHTMKDFEIYLYGEDDEFVRSYYDLD